MKEERPQSGLGAAGDARREPGRIWCGLAATVLLVCVGVRPFISELPFRVSAVRIVQSSDGQGPQLQSGGMHAGELSRVVLATILLAAVALWLIGSARSGQIRIYHSALGGLILLFAVLSALSAMGAANQRAAWTAWLEQVSLLGAGFLAVQLCRNLRMFQMVVVLLAALGMALAVKGLYQVAVEFPDNALMLKADGARMIREAGKAPGTVEAEAFTKRLLATTPHGYFSLSNPFASMLMVMAFAGAALAMDKIASARRDRAERRSPRGRGEISTPFLAAGLTTVAAAAVAVTLVLTRSRGAIAAAVVMAACCAVTIRYRRGLARFRRTALLACGAAIGACAVALIAYGLAHDSLPTTTMTYRWYYWTASARIIRDNALLGVGPGNFATAYLRNRRVEGEEEIKMPHNAAIHALAQYGLAGGLCYLGVLGCVLVGMARPSDAPQERCERAGDFFPSRGWTVVTAICVTAGVFLARWFFVGPGAGAAMIFMEAACPSVVLGAALLLAWWLGPAASGLPGTTARAVLACGVGAFVLHNMVTYSLWMSGAAIVFWVGAGACLGASGGGKVLRITAGRWPVSLAAAAATAGAAWLLCGPVTGAWLASRSMAERLGADDIHGAIVAAERMGRADPLDAQSASDAARVLLHAAYEAPSTARGRDMAESAYRWSLEAVDRDAADSAHQRLAGNILWHALARQSEALEHMARASELDPMNARLRVQWAKMLMGAGRARRSLQEISIAIDINARLPRRKGNRRGATQFTDVELSEIRDIRRRAEARRR